MFANMNNVIEWNISPEPLLYEEALQVMEHRVRDIQADIAPEMVWLLEHCPVYTAGTSANQNELLNTNVLPVINTGRGGKYTYHGPGQRIAYVMINLKKRAKDKIPDLKEYIKNLEQWLINSLLCFGINGERRPSRIGIWVQTQAGKEEKIAAIGVRVSKWITYHGIALNVNPEMSYFNSIIPCGIKEYGVTSMQELGYNGELYIIDQVLKREFHKIFG
ncbi:Octanoyltransferase [Rickettsiales bacterium Ac37b]|nr:Octanoyltransferase [Rickettsiales bacterium Ac37b]